MILARTDGGLIGDGGRIPWHYPADLKHFKRMTWGKPVIMGRKTFEGLTQPLSGRAILLITSSIHNPPVHPYITPVYVGSPQNIAQYLNQPVDIKEIVVAGGKRIYDHFQGRCSVIYETLVPYPSKEPEYPIYYTPPLHQFRLVTSWTDPDAPDLLFRIWFRKS